MTAQIVRGVLFHPAMQAVVYHLAAVQARIQESFSVVLLSSVHT